MKLVSLPFLLFAALTVPAAIAASPGITISGGAHTPIMLNPERSSGLEVVAVVDAASDQPLTANYTPSTPGAAVSWSKFSTLGGGFAEPIAGADGYTLEGLEGDMGYIVTEGNRQYCFWITDYAKKPFSVSALSLGEQDCSTATLIPEGEGERMTYYTINGRAVEIDREITVSYSTLTYDEAMENYRQEDVQTSFAYLRSELHVEAPLSDTRFIITGDRFLRQWGEAMTAESPLLAAKAVAATVKATQEERSVDNEQTSASDGALGGSAPVVVAFQAAVTDAAIFTEWQMSSFPEFDIVDLRFTDPVFDYTFRESGTTYVRFVAANADASCEYYSETFTVAIGDSDLKCPNAFTPGASEGVNDEWRVSYKSIISFECHIFSRSGRQVAHLTDPSQGWDGRIGGKLAPAGVYYYVIRAEGSDGKKYNLSGDINIIRYK